MLDYLNIRRDLHQIPEIGLEEYKTHAYLMQVIDGLTAGLDQSLINISDHTRPNTPSRIPTNA